MSIIKNPSIWGPELWQVLHYLTFQYNPLTQYNDMKLLFIEHLPNIMPCKSCREKYKEHIKKKPIRLKSRDSLSKWLIDIHNLVNITKKNPTRKHTYKEVRQKYHLVLAQSRVMNSFLKWCSIIKPYIYSSDQVIKSSYSFFISFIFKSNFIYK